MRARNDSFILRNLSFRRSTLAHLQAIRTQAAEKLKLQNEKVKSVTSASKDVEMSYESDSEDLFDWRSKGV